MTPSRASRGDVLGSDVLQVGEPRPPVASTCRGLEGSERVQCLGGGAVADAVDVDLKARGVDGGEGGSQLCRLPQRLTPEARAVGVAFAQVGSVALEHAVGEELHGRGLKER